jgi:small multidrug resistance family-3 protein
MGKNLLVFVVAAFLEIAGCFTFWAWLRRAGSPLLALAGVASLIGFAITLTHADSAFAGRAYAAYGGIYIAASLVWLWLGEGQRPSLADLLGAALAIGGAVVIVSMASRVP